jgi:hypothetical protein
MVHCQAHAEYMQGVVGTVLGLHVFEVPLASASDVGYAVALAVSQQAVDLHLHAFSKVPSCVRFLALLTDTCSRAQQNACKLDQSRLISRPADSISIIKYYPCELENRW